jgi:hypothetical protein
MIVMAAEHAKAIISIKAPMPKRVRDLVACAQASKLSWLMKIFDAELMRSLVPIRETQAA